MRDTTESAIPTLRQVVLDCEDARSLAEFYRKLLGFHYRPGDEPPAAGTPTREATTGWCCATPPAPPGWRSSRWRTCQSRHGQRDLDRRCCTSIPPFQAWATCVFSMTACLLSGRAFSLTDPTMKMSPYTSTPTHLGTHFASSWLHSWVRRGVLDSQERPA